MEWTKTSDQLPTPNTQVLIAYAGGAFYLGYWQALHNLSLGKSKPEWSAYNVGGVQNVLTPDFWMYVPSVPRIE
jgi:hypothetical protein